MERSTKSCSIGFVRPIIGDSTSIAKSNKLSASLTGYFLIFYRTSAKDYGKKDLTFHYSRRSFVTLDLSIHKSKRLFFTLVGEDRKLVVGHFELGAIQQQPNFSSFRIL